MKIAVPITATTLDDALRDIDRANKVADVIELRLDYLRTDIPAMVKRCTKPVIATLRPVIDGGRFTGSERARRKYLFEAKDSGAEYIDVESHVFSEYGPYRKTKLIISYHDFKETPQNLQEMCSAMADTHADVVKIATRANSASDCERMLDCIARSDKPMIGICMGPLGVGTRVLGPLFGGYLTFASLSSEKASAPGQLTVEELRGRWAALGYGPGRI